MCWVGVRVCGFNARWKRLLALPCSLPRRAMNHASFAVRGTGAAWRDFLGALQTSKDCCGRLFLEIDSRDRGHQDARACSELHLCSIRHSISSGKDGAMGLRVLAVGFCRVACAKTFGSKKGTDPCTYINSFEHAQRHRAARGTGARCGPIGFRVGCHMHVHDTHIEE